MSKDEDKEVPAFDALPDAEAVADRSLNTIEEREGSPAEYVRLPLGYRSIVLENFVS